MTINHHKSTILIISSTFKIGWNDHHYPKLSSWNLGPAPRCPGAALRRACRAAKWSYSLGFQVQEICVCVLSMYVELNIHIRVSNGMHACMYVCMYVRTYLCTYVYIYTYYLCKTGNLGDTFISLRDFFWWWCEAPLVGNSILIFFGGGCCMVASSWAYL